MDSSICASEETVEVGSNTNSVSKLASQGVRTMVLEENKASSNSASSLAALEEENRRYRESHLCKVCLDNEVGVVFLPCGHLVSCVHCAPSLKDCPVCRRSIGACVRTYLS
ncbi:hypothetical protein J437_LFUL007130 [Ladona fulva]|uniref:RING-type domain-containing protein n=1 Tax=Ladona fulva TaxID=123851 RepID=A0A8K0K6M2_LADFU|nr:hypothetical protein J437_LFUL007130 [Ladona fulva]